MAEKLRGLRIITNLNCNYNCKFCYQKRKTRDILPLANLKEELKEYSPKYFEYCTIMGGESTLLPNLTEYIQIGKIYSNEVRLTTNGSILTKDLLLKYKEAGLDGITISIATLEKYKETTKGFLSKDEILNKVKIAKEIFPNVRVNIALCKENMNGEIKKLVEIFVSEFNINITICESITQEYSCLNDTKKYLDSEIVEDTGYGLVIMKHNGRKFGYYSHKDNYKHTDLVISPLGTWTNWDGYCEVIE